MKITRSTGRVKKIARAIWDIWVFSLLPHPDIHFFCFWRNSPHVQSPCNLGFSCGNVSGLITHFDFLCPGRMRFISKMTVRHEAEPEDRFKKCNRGFGRKEKGVNQILPGYVCPSNKALEHLSDWFAGPASWRTAFLLEKCVLHGQTVEQTALTLKEGTGINCTG